MIMTLPLDSSNKRRKLMEGLTVCSSRQQRFATCNSRLKMVAGSCYLPKVNESKPLGEDAHFICDEENIIGLADGVGSWAKRGIDSGEYARELMNNVSIEIEDQPTNFIDPLRALNEAFCNTNSQGSSTACIISLKKFPNLSGSVSCYHAVNVGDSGFLVIRNGKVVYESPRQQHRFNCPYQLGNSRNSDTPASAEVIVVEAEYGDIIVAGTDGLFDNLFPAEIESIVVEICRKEGEKRSPVRMAATLANIAREVSCVENWMCPFSKAAMEEGLCDSAYVGGKYDDVTVIVAYVEDDDDRDFFVISD